MPTSDPLQILLSHDQWATRQILQACQELSEEQFHQKFEMGLGSLHDTLTHIVGAMRGWGDMLAEREQRERLELNDTIRTPDELIRLVDEASLDLVETQQGKGVDEWVSGQRGGRTFRFLRGSVLTHVTTHGMHHRAQCLNMLRHLGVDPLPPSSVLEWMLMDDLNE